MSETPEPSWPPSVKPIDLEDLRRLGIDGSNQLFWDGRRIVVRQRLILTGFQKLIAAIVTACAILGGVGGFMSGINNAALFLCARDVGWMSCPALIATR